MGLKVRSNMANQPLANVGDVAGGNYAEIAQDGTITVHGDGSTYDDVWFLAGTLTQESGLQNAAMQLFSFEQTGTAAGSIYLDGSDSSDSGFTFPKAYDSSSGFQVGVWFIPQDYTGGKEREIFHHPDFRIYLRRSGSHTKVKVRHTDWYWNETLGNVVVGGANSLLLSVNDGGYLKWSLNGAEDSSYVGTTSTNTASDVRIGNDGTGNALKGFVDELRVWNRSSNTQSLLDGWHNDGAGHVSETWETANLVSAYHLDGANALTAFEDWSATKADGTEVGAPSYGEPPIIAGTVPATTGGVYAYSFPSDGEVLSVAANLQLPHNRMDSSLLYPHLHWAKGDSQTGIVVWKMEYQVLKLFSTASATTTVETTTFGTSLDSNYDLVLADPGVAVPREHVLSQFAPLDIGVDLSTVILARIYRDISDARDTYPGTAHLLAWDAHYIIDQLGSCEQFRKHDCWS